MVFIDLQANQPISIELGANVGAADFDVNDPTWWSINGWPRLAKITTLDNAINRVNGPR